MPGLVPGILVSGPRRAAISLSTPRISMMIAAAIAPASKASPLRAVRSSARQAATAGLAPVLALIAVRA